MPSRRSEISMSDDEVGQYLASERILHVATIGPSGHPHLVAMWYAMVDHQPVFWTFGKSQKILNLRRDARMTGLVETGAHYGDLRGVELVGSGRLVEDYAEIRQIGIVIGRKYQGDTAVSEQGMPFIEHQARKRIGVVFDVERVASWDHRKLGGAY
jgi:hypothetical protein